MLWEAFKLAILSVRRNVLRSVLTLLGIVIGVAAVIAMVTIGDGTTQKVDRGSLEARQQSAHRAARDATCSAPAGPARRTAPSTTATVVALRSELTGVRAIAPASTRAATIVYGALN